jgi:hypothetical protein
VNGPTEWGNDEEPSRVPRRPRASRLAQVLLAFGGMILLAGAGFAVAILAARRASVPYPIAVFQRPLIEVVIQGVPERLPTDTPTAIPTSMPSPTPEPTPLPSATIPDVGSITPTAAPPEEP